MAVRQYLYFAVNDALLARLIKNASELDTGMDDAKNEMIRVEELEQARKEVDKTEGKKAMRQNRFKIV